MRSPTSCHCQSRPDCRGEGQRCRRWRLIVGLLAVQGGCTLMLPLDEVQPQEPQEPQEQQDSLQEADNAEAPGEADGASGRADDKGGASDDLATSDRTADDAAEPTQGAPEDAGDDSAMSPGQAGDDGPTADMEPYATPGPWDLSMCEAVVDCDGDPEGVWLLRGTCAAEVPPEICGIEVVEAAGVPTGTVTLTALSSYEWSLSVEGDYANDLTLDVGSACDGVTLAVSEEDCLVFEDSLLMSLGPAESSAECHLVEDAGPCRCKFTQAAQPLQSELVTTVAMADVCVDGDQMVLAYRVPDDLTYYVQLERMP